MEVIIQFQRRIKQATIGIPTQVNMTQQILVEQSARQVGYALVGTRIQLRDGLRILSINDDKTRRGRTGKISEDVIIAKGSHIVEMVINGLQSVTGRIKVIGGSQVLSGGTQHLLSLVGSNTLAHQNNMLLIRWRQFGRALHLDDWNASQSLGVRIKPGCKDRDQDWRDNAYHASHNQAKNAGSDGATRKIGGHTATG